MVDARVAPGRSLYLPYIGWGVGLQIGVSYKKSESDTITTEVSFILG